MSATDDAASAAGAPIGEAAMPSGVSAISSPIPLSGRLLSKPFIDRLCLLGFRWLLPASHAWAAAGEINGDVDAFVAAFALRNPSQRLIARLQETARLRRAADTACAIWEDAAFSAGTPVSPAALSELDVIRRRTAQAYSGHRQSYIWFAHKQRLPAVPYRIPDPDAALAPFIGTPSAIDRLFAVPEKMPEIEVSHPGLVRGVKEYWLRFRTPALPEVIGAGGETVWVHVYEPANATSQTPNLIWAHGLSMELEMMEAGPLDFLSIARAGIRVLMPDGPGHNRRTVSGYYGGESFLRSAPISGLHHFSQAGSEFAAMIDWCHRLGNGRVALGGISLGALSAQVAASHMDNWPTDCRPDALLLLTTTDEVSALVTDSALGQVADVDQAVSKAGWNSAHVKALAAITDARPTPPLDPNRIVLLLGRRDNVTPYAGGVRLATNWQLPERNVFVRDQGHFSAAFGLAVDASPYYRLLDILRG